MRADEAKELTGADPPRPSSGRPAPGPVPRQPLRLPSMDAGLMHAWSTLMDLSGRHPDHWCLVGGQAVHLHCWERGGTPNRPTNDADVVLSVRAWPQAVFEFTTTLRELGFTSDGVTTSGHEYRWVDQEAQIDLLIPRHLGERAENRRGVTGSTVIATPGAETVLSRSEPLAVDLEGRVGTILRPTLAGMLLGKAAAYVVIPVQAAPERHLVDIATLAALVTRADLLELQQASGLEMRRLRSALASIEQRHTLAIPRADIGLARIRAALDTLQ